MEIVVKSPRFMALRRTIKAAQIKHCWYNLFYSFDILSYTYLDLFKSWALIIQQSIFWYKIILSKLAK